VGGDALLGERHGVFPRIHMLIAANVEIAGMVRSVEVERIEGTLSPRLLWVADYLDNK